ncbi:hypothetical protein WICPIJ_000835 [Wickerhamomyces pijperi]|uniref:Zn(2)-C6 fungal-type domain-containing protein n=1 Tax=Wickerhamomyces pijperi TaxID=599730 RepID=A0A9P8QC32_WICPI|nr:hypothetical protein WICPIJ_000835 [Wickerhamomyces pijperi]
MSESSSSTPLSTPSNTPTAVTASLSSSSVINGFGNPHRISKDSPAHGSKNATDKKGRSTSCLLCQKRKQKCDHRLPSCTTCIKAGVECVQPLKYSVKAPEKDEYTVMLEKKVKFLEKIIDTNNIVVESKNKKSSFKFKKFSPFIKDEAQTETPDIIAGTNATGSSITQEQYEHSLVANYNLVEFITLEPLFSIDEQSSKLMLDIYFSQIHFKYPLLNEDEMYDFHNTFISDQKTQPQQQQQQQNDLLYNFNCAKLFCVFAIGSVLYMSTHYKSGIKTDHPSRYFATCLKHLMECGDKLGYEDKVKMLNLIVLYLIRTDFDSNLLHDIIKDALNISVYKLNLNKSLTYQNLPFGKKQNYLRIWWCNYLLERSIAISVGRPYSIPEYQIDEELPMILKPFIIQSIKLRRIESKFVEFFKLSSIKQISNLNLLKKLDEFFQLLEKWRMKIENNISNHEMETLRLYYYRSIRLLIQPFLEILDPNEKLFKECQAAAGQICQLFKKFHENTVYGHSTTAIHSVFNAGVTLIYCLWITRNKDDERRRALGDVSKHTRPQVSQSLFISMNDLRACSICLYVMNERSKFALAFRNIFDQLMFATINNLIERCGEDSSEIIYTNKPGMPPAIVRRYQYIPEYLEYHKQQEDAAHRDDGRNISASFNNDDSPTSNGGTDSDERSETGSNRSRKYGLNPHIKNLINNSKLYGDDKERMIKQNNLQKSIIPKSLSHLLINSPDGTSSKSSTSPSSSANSSSNNNNNKTTNSNSSNTNPSALNEQILSLPSPHSKSIMATPMANGNRHSSISSMTNAAATAGTSGQQQQQ